MSGDLKIVLKVMADILFAKGVITPTECEGMNDISSFDELYAFTDTITRG